MAVPKKKISLSKVKIRRFFNYLSRPFKRYVCNSKINKILKLHT